MILRGNGTEVENSSLQGFTSVSFRFWEFDYWSEFGGKGKREHCVSTFSETLGFTHLSCPSAFVLKISPFHKSENLRPPRDSISFDTSEAQGAYLYARLLRSCGPADLDAFLHFEVSFQFAYAF